MAKSNQYAQDTELERMESLDTDREFKILEQKRWDDMWKGYVTPQRTLTSQEQTKQDIEIYKQGRLEY